MKISKKNLTRINSLLNGCAVWRTMMKEALDSKDSNSYEIAEAALREEITALYNEFGIEYSASFINYLKKD